MGFETSDMRRLLEAFEASNWEDIHLSTPEFEIKISAFSVVDDIEMDRPSEAIRAKSSDNLVAQAMPTTAQEVKLVPSDAKASQVTLPDSKRDAGFERITAPTVGIFWRSPSPGAPPFAEVGQAVDPDTTVAIVEVMKLMNHVKAGVSGRVVESVAQNGKAVEAGDTLFVVEIEDAKLARSAN